MTRQRLTCIDFLKGIAIIAVVISHSSLAISGISPYVPAITGLGARGCQLFFILSGYTSYLSWTNTNSPKPIQFYKRRLLSVIPGYYLILLIWQLLCRFFPTEYLLPASAYTIGVNMTFLHGILTTRTDAVAGGWYMGALMGLYLVFPFIFKFVIKIYEKSKKILWITIFYISLLTISLIINVLFTILWDGNLKNIFNQSYTGLICQLAPYITGIILAHQHTHNELPRTNRYTVSLTFISLFIALYSSFASWVNIRLVVYTWSFFFYWLAVITLNNYDKIQNFAFTTPINTWGKSSYGIYLTHMLFSIYIIPLLVSCCNELLHISNIFIAYCLTFCIYIPVCFYSGLLFEKVMFLLRNIFIRTGKH